MYGNGLPGPTASGVRTGIDLALEALGELGQVLLGAVRDAADDDPFLRQRRLELTLPELRLLGGQREDSLANLGQRFLRSPAVG